MVLEFGIAEGLPTGVPSSLAGEGAEESRPVGGSVKAENGVVFLLMKSYLLWHGVQI